jgi:hypothetical protein
LDHLDDHTSDHCHTCRYFYRSHAHQPRRCPAEKRIGGRSKKLDDTKRREITEAVMSGRKTAAQMARMFKPGKSTVINVILCGRAS